MMMFLMFMKLENYRIRPNNSAIHIRDGDINMSLFLFFIVNNLASVRFMLLRCFNITWIHKGNSGYK